MIGRGSGTTRYRSLEASRRALARMAPLVRWGLLAVGASVFLDQVRPLVSDAQFTWGERRVMGAVGLVTLGGFGLAAWAAGRLLTTAAELIDVFVESAEATVQAAQLIEAQVVPAMNRMCAAMERLAAQATASETLARNVATARQALRAGRWSRVESSLQAIARSHPDAPELAELQEQLDQARRAESDKLKDALEAAIAADEPDRAIDLRDALTQHLHGPALDDLDRRVVRWLSDHIQSRAQVDGATPELARLAERAADSFGDTAEGAALLAALPRLRRRAGLCTRCGAPNPGPDDACPECRSPAPRNAPSPSRRGRP